MRVPRGRCHRTVHNATVVQKVSFALLRRRSLCSFCFPKNSTDVDRKKQFPTPCTCTGTRSAGASVGYMMSSSRTLRIIDNPSRSLSRPVVDQSLSNTGQRIVIVCCPSFPWHKGARRETVAIDPRGGFPEDELFVCSFSAPTWQRGLHFSGWSRPAIALKLLHLFLRRSLVCLTPFLSQNAKKKKRNCIMPSCDFLASFACALDQVRARIGLTE